MKIIVNRFRRSGFAMLALLSAMAIRPAHAQLTLCNRTTMAIDTAIVGLINNSWSAAGWFGLAAGECKVVLSAVVSDSVYVRAQNQSYVWETGTDPKPFCVSDQPFSIPTTGAPCTANQHAAQFVRLDSNGRSSILHEFTCDICQPPKQQASIQPPTRSFFDDDDDDYSPTARAPASVNVPEKETVKEVHAALPQPGGDHYYLMFAARNNTVTGHAFVIWAKESQAAAASSYEGYGLNPQDESPAGLAKMFFGPVPGVILNEAAEHHHSWPATTDRLIVEVDAATFNTTHYIYQLYSRKPVQYQPIMNDCVTFLEGVALTAGLNIPNRNLFTLKPQAYVRALMETVDATQHISLANGFTWDGPVVNKLPNGHGTYNYGNGSRYTGDVIAGIRSGNGIYYGPEGRFEGYFENGSPTRGTSYLRDGSVAAMAPAGKESFKYASGATFEGDATVTTAGYGHGRYSFPDGTSFEGDFRNKTPVTGTYHYRDGSTFTGSFENDQPHQGTFRGSDGVTFTGTLGNYQPQGRGTMIFRDGSRYEGDFVNGSATGHGQYSDHGMTYVGDFRDSLREGHGTITFADGSRYEGTFANGVTNGQGTYTDPQGNQSSQNWTNGNLNVPNGGGSPGRPSNVHGNPRENMPSSSGDHSLPVGHWAVGRPGKLVEQGKGMEIDVGGKK